MKLKLIQQSVLALTLLSTSFFVFAENQSILCPSIDLVKKSTSALNTVSFLGGKYAVWSLNYAFIDSNLNWQVMSYADAPDFNAAFNAGQNNVKNVNGQVDKYAMDSEYFYMCRYSGVQEASVLTIAFKGENAKFKFASFDLNLLNGNGKTN
jgi:hypothetical protein